MLSHDRNARSSSRGKDRQTGLRLAMSLHPRLPGMIRPSCYPRDVEAVDLGCPCPDDDPIGPASSKAHWFLAALFSRSLRWSCPCLDAFRCRAAVRPDFLAVRVMRSVVRG